MTNHHLENEETFTYKTDSRNIIFSLVDWSIVPGWFINLQKILHLDVPPHRIAEALLEPEPDVCLHDLVVDHRRLLHLLRNLKWIYKRFVYNIMAKAIVKCLYVPLLLVRKSPWPSSPWSQSAWAWASPGGWGCYYSPFLPKDSSPGWACHRRTYCSSSTAWILWCHLSVGCWLHSLHSWCRLCRKTSMKGWRDYQKYYWCVNKRIITFKNSFTFLSSLQLWAIVINYKPRKITCAFSPAQFHEQ